MGFPVKTGLSGRSGSRNAEATRPPASAMLYGSGQTASGLMASRLSPWFLNPYLARGALKNLPVSAPEYPKSPLARTGLSFPHASAPHPCPLSLPVRLPSVLWPQQIHPAAPSLQNLIPRYPSPYSPVQRAHQYV